MTYPALPKWPQMYTTGRPVTLAQAKEIIRRTDTYFSSPEHAGNDRAYAQRIIKALGIPVADYELGGAELRLAWEREDAWRRQWGLIQTEYVHNTWIAAAYILGPCGWCHPDGAIGYLDSVGKWPSCEEIVADWTTLAAAFPFLHIDVTLMSGEECEQTVPVFGITVRDKVVEPCDPQLLHKDHPAPYRFRADMNDEDCLRARFGAGFHDNSAERGIPWSWIEEWAAEHGAQP